MKTLVDIHSYRDHISLVARELFDGSCDIFQEIHKQHNRHPRPLSLWARLRSIINFLLLTAVIFVVLLTVANWSAYSSFARVAISPDILSDTAEIVNAGIQATDVNVEYDHELEIRNQRKQKLIQRQLTQQAINTQDLGVNYFDQDVADIALTLDITPYEDRIVIPKIGKNIPLVNVDNHDADNAVEWEKIFMKELENGVVRYPGSAEPGQAGNSFIFGHSSNYPWAKGQYNEVFALLNELIPGDEIIVYFQQKKYVYVVQDKTVVKPGYVSAL